MIERFAARFLLLLLSGYLVLPLRSAESAGRASIRSVLPDAAASSSTNFFRPIAPGPIDGRVAFLTAAMLERNQYLKLPFDATVSSKFLDTYLETLDPQHIHFTQSDLAEFEQYRTNLNRLTLTERHVGDTRPGCRIFNRFFERLSERTDYAEQLLKDEKFTFDGSERIMLNRKGQPYPANLDAAKKLWRERLRFRVPAGAARQNCSPEEEGNSGGEERGRVAPSDGKTCRCRNRYSSGRNVRRGPAAPARVALSQSRGPVAVLRRDGQPGPPPGWSGCSRRVSHVNALRRGTH